MKGYMESSTGPDPGTVNRFPEQYDSDHLEEEEPTGGETPFVGNHGVKAVRNLKRLR